MKSVSEILAKIDELLIDEPNPYYQMGLRVLKKFILSSEECEHDLSQKLGFKYGWKCVKCGSTS